MCLYVFPYMLADFLCISDRSESLMCLFRAVSIVLPNARDAAIYFQCPFSGSNVAPMAADAVLDKRAGTSSHLSSMTSLCDARRCNILKTLAFSPNSRKIVSVKLFHICVVLSKK